MTTPLKELSFKTMRFMAEIWNTGGGGSLELSKGVAMNFLGMGREGWYWLRDEMPSSLESMLTPPTEEDVKLWVNKHVDWVYVIWSQGWGVKTQEKHQKSIRLLINLCHKHGVRVGAYFSLGNMFHRVFTREFPEALDWVQRNPDGSPVLYGGCPERYLTCLNRPGWINYHKEEIKRAVKAGADALLFDNVGFICYCEVCCKKFREYTLKKLGKACDPPESLNWADPVTRVFAEFRGETVAMVMKELSTYANTVGGRSVPVSYNAHTSVYSISQWAGLPVSLQNRSEDFIQSEDKSSDRYWPGGPEEYPPNDIELYKYETRFGRHFMHHAPHNGHYWPYPNLARLLLAQAAAFQSAVCFVTPEKEPSRGKVLDAVGEYLEFIDQNLDYYVQAESMSEAAVLYSHPNLYWYLARGERKPSHLNGFDRILIEGHVPFDFILEDQLSMEALRKYRVLVTPNVACLSDMAVDIIRDYVGNGGGLVATGETSLYDENLKKRSDYGLADVFNYHLGTSRMVEGTFLESQAPKGILGETTRNFFGKGRAIFFSDSPDRDYLYTCVPQVRVRLLEAVKWAMSSPLTFTADASPSVLIAPYKQRNRVVLHYVNYGRDLPPGLAGDNPIPQYNVKVALRVPEPRKVRYLSPDGPIPKVNTIKEFGAIHLTLPKLHIYTLGILEL